MQPHWMAHRYMKDKLMVMTAAELRVPKLLMGAPSNRLELDADEVPEAVLPELVELHLAVVDKVVKRSGAVELFQLRLSLRAT